MRSVTVLPREQIRTEVGALLARALGRLMVAEAEGRLTPAEARVVAEIRAEMAADAPQQQSAAA